jgi:hypothetical protein
MSREGLDKIGRLFDERLDNATYLILEQKEEEALSGPKVLYLTSEPVYSSEIYRCGKCNQLFFGYIADGVAPRQVSAFFRYDENIRYEIDPAAIVVFVHEKDLERVLALFGSDASQCKWPDPTQYEEFQRVFRVGKDTRYPVILNCRRGADGTIRFDVVGPRELLKRYRSADWK